MITTRLTRWLGNAIESLNKHRVLIASLFLLVWYVLNAAAYLTKNRDPALGLALERLVNRDGKYSTPHEQPIEAFEDLGWIGAAVLYLLILIRETRQKRFRVNPWAVILFALCFLACGEEMSWGYKYFYWKPDLMQRINSQGETNVHNLRPGAILGFPRNSRPYRALKSVWKLQNAAFESVTFLIWVVLPTLKQKGTGKGWRVMDRIFVPGAGTRMLFTCGAAVWAVAHLGQPLWGRFDVGEVFELTVATIALLAAIDAFKCVPSPGLSAQANSTNSVG